MSRRSLDRDAPQVLYRFWRNEELLYIGISINSFTRAAQHSRHADFWPEATHVTFEHHNNRDDVERAEKEAIRAEMPIYNIAHALRGPEDQEAMQAARLQEAWIAYRTAHPETADPESVVGRILDVIRDAARIWREGPSPAIRRQAYRSAKSNLELLARAPWLTH